MGSTNLPEDIDKELRGPIQVNQALDVTTRQGFWNFQPDRTLTDQQDFDPYNVWYERNGGLAEQVGSGLYQVSTDGSTDSEAILETADIGIYRPGSTANVSGGVWVDTLPTGDAFYTIGYEQEGDTERLDFLVDSSGDLQFEFDSIRYTNGPFVLGPDTFERGTVTEVEDGGTKVAEVYGLRRTNGTGFVVDNYAPQRGYLYGVTLGWYGPTSVMPWIGEVGDLNGQWVQRAWPLAMIRPVGGPLVEQPNRPWSVQANSRTSGQSLQARLGGRQFSVSGQIELSAEPTFDWAEDQSVPTDGAGPNDWNVIAVFKRKAGFTGTGLGVDVLNVVPDSEDIRVLVRVVDPQYLTGVEYDEPRDTPAAQTALETDLETDTPDRVTIDTATIDGTTKVQGIGWTGGFANASNQGVGDTRIGAGFDFPVVREYPTVVLAASRTNQSATVDTNIEFLEAG